VARDAATAGIAAAVAVLCAGSAWSQGLVCPADLADGGIEAIQRVRTVLSAYSRSRAFDFADCAFDAASQIGPPDAADARMVDAYWRLVGDATFVLRSASEVARNAGSRNAYLENERELRERLLDAYGAHARTVKSSGDWTIFVKDYGDNLQRLGSPSARRFVLRVSDLGAYVLGPEGTDSYIRAIESCSVWDFEAGANRTSEERSTALCSNDCTSERELAKQLLKDVRLTQARIAVEKLMHLSGACANDVVGVWVGAP
jgi:hypothetical protein